MQNDKIIGSQISNKSNVERMKPEIKSIIQRDPNKNEGESKIQKKAQ